VRAAYEKPRFALAGFVEQQDERKLRRVDGSGRFLPLSWLGVSGAVSYYAPTQGGLFPTSLTYRGEVGVRLNRAWLSGGIMSRDTAQLIAPIVFDTGFTGRSVGAATGTFVAFRGKVWKDLGFDVIAVKWDSAGMLRPEYQTRSQLYIETGWRSRFPTGNLHILFAISHEYRTQALSARDQILAASQYRRWGAARDSVAAGDAHVPVPECSTRSTSRCLVHAPAGAVLRRAMVLLQLIDKVIVLQ
jgi:hypothetical protein